MHLPGNIELRNGENRLWQSITLRLRGENANSKAKNGKNKIFICSHLSAKENAVQAQY